MRFPGSPRLWFSTVLGLCVGVFVGVGAIIGCWWMTGGPGASLPSHSVVLNASASDNQGSFATATGQIDENTEGYFVLDFLTGQLQCSVIDHRNYNFYGRFETNISRDLPVDRTRDPKYALVTGRTNFLRGGGRTRPASTVCYVLDANTGRFAAYGISWDPGAASAGRAQEGALVKLAEGNARNAAIAP